VFERNSRLILGLRRYPPICCQFHILVVLSMVITFNDTIPTTASSLLPEVIHRRQPLSFQADSITTSGAHQYLFSGKDNHTSIAFPLLLLSLLVCRLHVPHSFHAKFGKGSINILPRTLLTDSLPYQNLGYINSSHSFKTFFGTVIN
jgi:hypothetical protein